MEDHVCCSSAMGFQGDSGASVPLGAVGTPTKISNNSDSIDYLYLKLENTEDYRDYISKVAFWKI